ncbi:MAG: hypothetical protein H6733_15610 [Alphaproteobacteria bacterium]|nr:hypothetical protein [Alphaproteobacteria bacterium]
MLIVSLLLAEGVVRLGLRLPGMPDRLDSACSCDQGRELGWYVSRLGSGGLVDFVHDPDLGWAPRPGGLGVTAAGTRDGRPVPPPSDGRKRLVLLGDSFAWGDDLDVADSLGPQLQARLPGWDVMNLAVPGYGHDQAVLRYERDGADLHADVVLMVFVDVDIPRNGARFFSAAKPWFALEDGALALHGVPVPTPEAMGWRLFGRSWLVQLLDVYRVGLTGDRGAAERHDQALTGAILDRFVADVRADGAVPVVLDAPTPDDRRRIAERAAQGKTPFPRFVDGWCATTDAACGSLFPWVDAVDPDDAAFRHGTHWSEAGSALIAEATAAWLVDHGVVADDAP